MTELIVAVLGIAILLYVLLGGADFGAGIVEIITGKKGNDTISRAIAPVWEANHVWIILAVVIMFNGFPLAYTVMSTYLHIPLLILLIGIIIRGSAFSFRYYDILEGNVHTYYSWFFRISSLLTPFFFGIVLGALILGRIPSSPDMGTFKEVFIDPWLNWFSVTTGIFITLLFAWIASVYLTGEADENSFPLFKKTSVMLFTFLFLTGIMVFVSSEYSDVHFFSKFKNSIVSIGCVIIATLIIPLLWRSISNRKTIMSRILAGIITSCIMVGWFAVQFPVLINMADGDHITIWNSQGPQKTMFHLTLALIFGSLIIFPSFAYLIKIFKFSKDTSN